MTRLHKPNYIIPFLWLFAFTGCGESDKKSGKPGEVVVTEEPFPKKSPVDPETTAMVEGKLVYEQYCLVCHQVNGGGVPGLNPPLRNTEYVLGDEKRLIGILVRGSNEGLLINGVSYNNAMPGFANLSDMEIAHVATYIRNSFGNAADPITPDLVAEVRDKE